MTASSAAALRLDLSATAPRAPASLSPVRSVPHSMASWSDERLLAAHREGEGHALEVLLRRHQSSIRRVCERMAGGPEPARDLLQETMLGIVRNLANYRGDAAFMTWVFAIARSFAARQRRRAFSTARLEAAMRSVNEVRWPNASSGELEANVDRARLQKRVREAVARLPPRDGAVLLARDFTGFSAAETAARLGLTVSAVKSRLHRARNQLRLLLVEDGGRDDLV